MTPTTIIRAPRDKTQPYFMMRRKSAQDNALSFEARGVLAYLLSKPDDWKINRAALSKEGGIGRDKTLRILGELEDQRYLVRQRAQNEKGKFSGIVYLLHEIPFTEKPQLPTVVQGEQLSDQPDTANTDAVEPRTALPDTAEPCTANPHHTYKRKGHNTESTDSTASKNDAVTPPPAKPEKPPTIHQAMFQAVCDSQGWDTTTLTKSRGKQIGKIAREMLSAHAEPEHIAGLWSYVLKRAADEKWSSKPTLNALEKYWPDYWKVIKPRPILKVPEYDLEAHRARVMATGKRVKNGDFDFMLEKRADD